MPEYTAVIKDSSVVVAAEPDKNRFSIEITPKLPTPDKMIVRLSIPVGPGKAGEKTFLLKDQAARPTVTYRLPGDSNPNVKMELLSKKAVPKASENCVAAESTSTGIHIAADTTMRIDVSRVGGNTPNGKAEVIVGIREWGWADDKPKPFTDQTLPVDVSPKPGAKPVGVSPGDKGELKIHYFDASKDYVLHAGGEEVSLFWQTTSAAKAVTLFKNQVRVWPPMDGSSGLPFTDKPAITSVYRLEARTTADDKSGESPTKREQSLKEGQLAVRTLTVQVAQAGWNREPLHQGYPTVLMVHTIKGKANPPLYGVFVDPKTEAKPLRVGLYSSATGFPPWKMESDFNDKEGLSKMSHSPGVACGDKLWLIGGSSVDPTKTSNEVWYYYDAGTDNMEWVRTDPGPFPARMGHCVVEFNGELWVLGGFDGNNPLNDMWSCKPSAAKPTWEYRGMAQWPQRCLFAAVATPASPGVPTFEKQKMWVYGGTKDPDTIKAMTDLWSTTNGITWEEEKKFEFGALVGQPNGATLFWDLDRLHLAGSFKVPKRDILQVLAREIDIGRLSTLNTKETISILNCVKGDPAQDTGKTNFTGATLSAIVYSLCPERFLWEANPVSWGWEQFGGDAFLMQSIVFNRFWFFWSLKHNMERVPKLNVFIPS